MRGYDDPCPQSPPSPGGSTVVPSLDADRRSVSAIGGVQETLVHVFWPIESRCSGWRVRAVRKSVGRKRVSLVWVLREDEWEDG